MKPVGIEERKAKGLLWIAIILELMFFMLFFTDILSKMPVYIGAVTCLLIGFGSLFISVNLLVKKFFSAISLLALIFSILIIFFTIVVYFLPEAGYPPPIRLFF